MSLKVVNKPITDDMKDQPPKFILPKPTWIPNVQEMVKNDPSLVPEMYIRNKPVTGNVKRFVPAQIPVIDLAMLRKGSKEELLKLDMACKDWGFFQLKNAVPTQLLQKMKNATTDFFNLPLYEKNKYAMPTHVNVQGYGHVQVENEDHKLDWSDGLLLQTQPTRSRDYRFWPKTPKEYMAIIDKYSREVNEVGMELLNYLSVILEKDKPIFLGSPVYFLVNYYPPCSKPDQVLCMSPHFDANSITLVMQDQDDVTELEIKHEGVWVPVHPIRNALVCNIGDFIQKWSNLKYKSVEHRVVANKTKLRSVHEVILMPSSETMHPEPNNVADYVNRYLKRKGSMN